MVQERSLDAAVPVNRWVQLVVGVICMVMIANLQYGWTYFVDPMVKANGWSRTTLSWAFTIFVATETWLVPVEGWFVDRFGPRIVVMFGGIVVAIAWTLNSMASSLPMLFTAQIIAGIGAGAVYGTCVGNALKWFADRRGFAAGLTAAGFGAGSAATVAPILYVITNYGYARAFLWFGMGQGLVILVLSQLLKAPKPGEAPAAPPKKTLANAGRDYTPSEMLRTPLFWILYVMFVLVASSGLVVTAQVASIARDYKIANLPVSILFIGSTTLVAAGVVDNILNGLARPTFGWVSDHIGRENTMAIVFTIGAGAYWALGSIGTTPYMFILTAGLVYFTWGEIYSLFPATCTDSYGSTYAATNAGLLYTAKGVAAGAAPLAVMVQQSTGSWHTVFVVAAIANVLVGATALLVVKPMRMATRSGIAPVPKMAPVTE